MQLLNNVNNDKNLSCKPRSFSKDWSCLTLSTQVFTLDLGCRFGAFTLLLMCTKIYTNLTDETNFLQGPSSNKVKSLQFNHWPLKNMVTHKLHKCPFYRMCYLFLFLFIYIYIFFQAETLLFHHLRFLDHVGDGGLNTVCTNKLWYQGNTCHYHACL